MNITYDYYRVFYYVARCGSFTRAAQALLSNQPNVSKAIQNLENQLGCALFARSHRGVQLTEAGERLYAHARIAFDQLSQAEQELRLDASGGVINIGASETALHGALLPVLKRFQAGHPQVRCCIRNDTNQQTTQALLDGEADIALVTSPVSLPGSVRRTSLSSFQELLVGGRQFAALAQGAHTLRELTQYPWIGLRRGTQTHAWHTQLFLREQLIYCPDVEAATAAQLLPLLLHQLGIGFIPQWWPSRCNATGRGGRFTCWRILPGRSTAGQSRCDNYCWKARKRNYWIYFRCKTSYNRIKMIQTEALHA